MKLSSACTSLALLAFTAPVAYAALINSPPPQDGVDHCCVSTFDCDPCFEACDRVQCLTIADGCKCSTDIQQSFGPHCDDVAPCEDDPTKCCSSVGVPEDYFSCDTSLGEWEFCPGTTYSGGGGGDPHYKTWGGNWFDYHGICDSVLVHAKEFGKGLGLDIHVRTKERFGYSFIESAAIRIGDSILEVSSYGEYILNGVVSAALPALMDEMYEVQYKQINKKRHQFIIPIGGVGSKEYIEVDTFKDMVSIKIEYASDENFGNSVGLMGRLSDGKMLGRDGVTDMSEDPVAFGQEWQVLDSEPTLFQQEDRAPQYPQKCIIPDPNSATGRRLGEAAVTKDEAQAACAHWAEAERHMCVFDILAMGDLELAQARDDTNNDTR